MCWTLFHGEEVHKCISQAGASVFSTAEKEVAHKDKKTFACGQFPILRETWQTKHPPSHTIFMYQSKEPVPRYPEEAADGTQTSEAYRQHEKTPWK